MALTKINVGTAANDGTGDTLRAAMQKVNAAFDVVDTMLKSNFAATTAPTQSDDSSKGYAIGSPWLIPATGDQWRARSVAVNAAQWVKIDTADFDTFIVGRYYLPFGVSIGGSFSPTTAGILRLAYGVVKQRVSIDQLVFRTLASGQNAQLGVYRSVNLSPTGTPVAKTPTIACASTAIFAAAIDAGPITLEPGPYWFASQVDVSTNCITYAANPFTTSLIGSAVAMEVISGVPIQALQITNTFGNWPDLTGATLSNVSGNSVTPVVAFRVASVP